MIVVTGRMVQSVRRFLEPAELNEPVICYQGAVVADADGKWLRHEPIPLELALEALAALKEEGYDPNVYIDDELYVSDLTQAARDYADFQHLTIHEVGDTLEWLSAPPTKLVGRRRPSGARRCGRPDESELRRAPLHLEVAAVLPRVRAGGRHEGRGPRLPRPSTWASRRSETVAFGDGENDVELVEWPAYGVAVANAHERVKAVADWVCPPASEEGVAQVIEALLDSKR